MDHTHRCPKCNTPCSIQKDVFPNFTCNFFLNIVLSFVKKLILFVFLNIVNQIIERYKEDNNNKKCKLSQNTTSSIIDFINSAPEELKIEDVNQLIHILAQRKEELNFVKTFKFIFIYFG